MTVRTKTAILAIAALTLSACADRGIEVDQAGAARAAQSPPDLVAVAEAMRARTGSEIGAGLTLADARAEGDILALDLRHEDAAAAFTPARRDAFVFAFDRDFGAQMCAAPATRSFVEERGGVRATIVTQDGQPLAARTISTCTAASG